MKSYIGADGIKVVVFGSQTPEEIAEENRKWREYLDTPHIKALRALKKFADEHDAAGDADK